MIDLRRFASMDRRKLILGASVLAGFFIIAIFALSAIPVKGRKAYVKSAIAEDELSTRRGRSLAGELVYPGVTPYEPEFPLVKARKARYTVEDALRLMPDAGTVDTESLRIKRKERLEALYSAVR